ncbi:MAG: hypothetical protein RL266_685 [Bacteroidota bacterium]|jgi:uncharacterized protein involved in tolerance to divalent cations
MIFLRIASTSEPKIERIAHLLLEEKLVIDVNIKRHIERAELVNGELKWSKIYLLTAKTKATLFDTIDKRLNKEFPNNLPEIYALPIVEMDWKQAENLTKSVAIKPTVGRIRSVIQKMRTNRNK